MILPPSRTALITAIAAALIGLSAWALAERNRRLSDQATALQAELISANENVIQLQRNLLQLADQAAANDRAQAKLRSDMAVARSLLARRAATIEELTHENASLREWSATPLPDVARQLRERPEFTSAAAYRAWLSERDGLSVTGEQPDQQRPATDAVRPD